MHEEWEIRSLPREENLEKAWRNLEKQDWSEMRVFGREIPNDFWANHAWAYKRKKRNTHWFLTFQFCYVEAHKCHWHCTFAMPKHTGVILWLAGNNGDMVIYAFLLGFSSPSRQKEWYEC